MKRFVVGLSIGAAFGWVLAVTNGYWLPLDGGAQYVASDIGTMTPLAAVGGLIGAISAWAKNRKDKEARQ